MNTRRQQGFTLIEAAVAIAVVAILSGIVVPLVIKNIQDSRIARAKNDVQVIAAAIASQMKDIGSRPSVAGHASAVVDGAATPPTGAGGAIWGSAGTAPTLDSGSLTIGVGNSFLNLFCPPLGTTSVDQLYGTTASTEFCYKGPYLANDVAAKTDPWGSRYLILGYNANGQTGNGPIWVVSAGPDRGTLSINTTAVGTPAIQPVSWTTTTTGADDIVMRVN